MVGILPQRLASSDVEALVAAALRCRNGSLQEDLGPEQGIPGAGAYAGSIARQIAFFADLDGLDPERGARRLQYPERGVHDFRADAVAVGDRDGSFRRHKGTSRILECTTPRNHNSGSFATTAPLGTSRVG